MVQQLHRVQLWAVAGQEVQLDPLGLLVGALGGIAWETRRQQPPPPTRSRYTVEEQGPRPRRLDVALSIGLVVAVALALTFAIARADWPVPVGMAVGTLLLGGCVFVVPRLFAPPRTPEDLADIEGLTAKDRIQLADDRRKLRNDVRAALLQAVVGGAVLGGVLFTWQQQQATNRQIANQLDVTRQGQVGERFSRAVGQLSNEGLDVRLGGCTS